MAGGLHSAKRFGGSRRTRVWYHAPVLFGAGVALVLGLGAGSAFAYFVSGGSGTGSTSNGTMLYLTVATAGTPSSPLLPGKSGDVVFTATNPNKFPVSIVGIALQNGDLVTPDAGHTGCTTTDGLPVVTLNIPHSDLPVSIASRATVSVDLANAAIMNLYATSNCQGATYKIPIRLRVQSS